MTDALLEALGLKDVARTGWVRRGVDSPESVAAHGWGVALLALALAPQDLDRGRLLAYAVLHDLAEAWVGDIPPQDGVTDKHAREARAMASFAARVGRPDLLALWEAYERQEDAEGRFVRQLDRLDMGLQARRYAAGGLDPAEFFASARDAVHTDVLAGLLDDAAAIEPVSSVLFLCVANSARSQLAEHLARHRFGDRVRVQSAGTAPKRPHPLALAALAEVGIDTAGARSKHVDEVDPDVDVVITLCAEEACPVGLLGVRQVSWAMPDPDDASLPEDQRMTGFRVARDAIARRLDTLVPR